MRSSRQRIFLDAMMMQEPAWPIVKRIESRFRDAITLNVGPGVWEEISHPRVPRFVRDRAEPLTLPVDAGAHPAIESLTAELGAVLRGDAARSFRHEKDARNLAEAAVLGGIRFLTEDRHLLRHTAEIGSLSGLEVVDAETFLTRLEAGPRPAS
ncbi:hypothetical protein GCM10011367_08580 [Marinicauda pacifica]|jgi:hypothetical protein|uniref:PIN domain-containing protein n=1 Tax=Marinicauda pacifica TaxID=1133559 RepID=A0A4S2HEL5_9PROT|nr:hypothetical protein [Marinicauda pacifica]TGY94510.1 hypothetical protein E5162_04340 [Marinicauda pacifica]GGE36450.1 hypothetical protein GCM10011367_08580 [Marinicauda pacifica]